MLRRFVGLSLALLLSWNGTVWANHSEEHYLQCAQHPERGRCTSGPSVGLVVDGRNVIMDPEPVIREDRLLVPVRAFSEALGAAVEWLEESRTVVISRATTPGESPVLVSMQPGNVTATVSRSLAHQDRFALDVPPVIIDGRLFAPFRLVAEAFGYHIAYDELTRTVHVTTTRQAEPSDFHRISLLPIKLSKSGYFSFEEPERGYPFMPATLRHLRGLVDQSNLIAEGIDTRQLAMQVMEGERRIRFVRRGNPDHPVLDLYPTHTVRWLDEFEAERLIFELTSEAKVGGATIGILSSVVGNLLRKEALAVKLLLVGLGAGGGYATLRSLKPDTLKNCLASSRLRQGSRKERVQIGLQLQWPHEFCLEEYTDGSLRQL